MRLTLNAFWKPRLGNHLGDYRPRVQVDREGGEGTRARGALVPRVGRLMKINALTFADEGHTVIKHVLILDDGDFGLWPLKQSPGRWREGPSLPELVGWRARGRRWGRRNGIASRGRLRREIGRASCRERVYDDV